MHHYTLLQEVRAGPRREEVSRRASDTGLGPSRVHLLHPQVVAVEVTVSLALSLGPSASPAGPGIPGTSSGLHPDALGGRGFLSSGGVCWGRSGVLSAHRDQAVNPVRGVLG